jgi:hypothetical protein
MLPLTQGFFNLKNGFDFIIFGDCGYDEGG